MKWDKIKYPRQKEKKKKRLATKSESFHQQPVIELCGHSIEKVRVESNMENPIGNW